MYEFIEHIFKHLMYIFGYLNMHLMPIFILYIYYMYGLFSPQINLRPFTLPNSFVPS